jgi:hypothetical protein
MKKQNCKVGSVTPIVLNRSSINLFEYQYQNFLDKASNGDAKLREYFEQKAEKVRKILENLV